MRLDTVLIKVASRCNINCSYCYVFNQGDTNWKRMPKFMSLETVDAVISRLVELYEDQQSPFAVVLHGGEPLLLPRHTLTTLLEGLAKSLCASCSRSIQTNGILIDDALLDLCARTETTLSISVDGPEKVHDTFRIAFNGNGSFERVIAGIERVKSHKQAVHLFTGALCVVDPSSNPKEIYKFFKDLAVPSVDFLFKDGNLAKLPIGKASRDSTEYGSWLASIWDCYVTDPSPPRIRVLDDLARLLLGGVGTKEGCGEKLYGIAVVDTDGTISKNDTLKSAYDGADRFNAVWSVSSARFSDIASSGEFLEYLEMQKPTSNTCRTCDLLHICGGGMPLTRWNDHNGLANPSVYCADYKLLIRHIRDSISVGG